MPGARFASELTATCCGCGIRDDYITVLQQLVTTSGAPDVVLPKVRALLTGITDLQPLEQLLQVVSALEDNALKAMLRFDFSVVDDIHYYNGIVFKGFIDGIPNSVLSGGQYDKLMQKMHRKSGAIGFAVYMDMLDRLDSSSKEYDVDTVLLYEEHTDLSQIRAQANALMQTGRSVMVQRKLPENIRYKQLIRLTGSEVDILENNA